MTDDTILTVLALARYEGIPRKTGIELSLMTRYAIFLIFVCLTGQRGRYRVWPDTFATSEFVLDCNPVFRALRFYSGHREQPCIRRHDSCPKYASSFDFLHYICHDPGRWFHWKLAAAGDPRDLSHQADSSRRNSSVGVQQALQYANADLGSNIPEHDFTLGYR